MAGWRKSLALMDSQSYSPREFGISALQPRTARDCAFIALGAANTEGAFLGSISAAMRDSRRAGATAQRVQIPARASTFPRTPKPAGHANSGGSLTSRRVRVGGFNLGTGGNSNPDRRLERVLVLGTPSGDGLPQPESSTGTTQSRRFPARAGKVIASAGQPQKRGSAELHSWREAQQAGRLDRTPLDLTITQTKNEAQKCKLSPEGAAGKPAVCNLNSAGLLASPKPTLDGARSREGYGHHETRVNRGKDALGAWAASASQQKQGAMPKTVCASAGYRIASRSRQGSNFPAVSGMPHVRSLVRAGGGFERYAVGALSTTDN